MSDLANIPQPKTPREKVLEGLFPEFVSLGNDRTYGMLGRKHGIEASELVRHARAFLWPERITALKMQHQEEAGSEAETVKHTDPDIENVSKLHLSRLRALQVKAYAHLEKCAFDKPETALKMLIDCMKLQREILGLSKDKDEDLRATMMKRLDEMSKATPGAAPAEPEFKFDPKFQVPPAPETETDGPEGNPAPPGGGDHAE